MKKLSILFAVIIMTGCAGMQGTSGSSNDGSMRHSGHNNPTKNLYFGA